MHRRDIVQAIVHSDCLEDQSSTYHCFPHDAAPHQILKVTYAQCETKDLYCLLPGHSSMGCVEMYIHGGHRGGCSWILGATQSPRLQQVSAHLHPTLKNASGLKISPRGVPASHNTRPRLSPSPQLTHELRQSHPFRLT